MVTFGIDTLGQVTGYDNGILYATNKYSVYDVGDDACRAPVLPHDGSDGSDSATWVYDEGASTITLNGVGAYLGLPKAHNEGELSSPEDAPESITYDVTFSDGDNTMTLVIEAGTGVFWTFKLVADSAETVPVGTWKMAPEAGALMRGPAPNDGSWWSNSEEDVVTRACYFDDDYVINADSSFNNVLGDETWIEEWQSTILVYQEDSTKFIGNHLLFRDTLDYWTLNVEEGISSDVFDGIQLIIDPEVETADYNYSESGWLVGNGIMRMTPSISEGPKMPWKYQIVFTDNDSAYVGIASTGTVRDENGSSIGSDKIANPAINFYVQNMFFVDSTSGQYELMDVIAQDMNNNDTLDIFEDRIFVGAPAGNRWRATAFIIDFQLATDATYPLSGDVYQVDWNRPFFESDTIRFSVSSDDSLNITDLTSDMKNIKVVPNPYVMTNLMEPALSNPFLNQRRRLLFTHIPATCTIKIFTVSGVLVDEINVENEPDNGIVHWDMLTREGLEIAAGMYLYHVESEVTGDEKLGKFAVIK
jgi:hypothetical protein